ncbi:MAG: SulP family inorganic anion transporter [Bacteroidota bacterium]
MNTEQKTGFFSNLKSDLPASIVVFLVALPLCLGIASASDAPLFSGLIAGIVGGTVVALMSGSPLGVSGPAAGLAAIVAMAVKDLGAFEIFLLATVIAGVIQITLGILKAGVIGYYFPTSVIKGMLAGIGIYIFWKQFAVALGVSKDSFKELIFSNPGELLSSANGGTLLITAIGLAILILWEQPFIKRQGFAKLIQGPLVAVLVGVGLVFYFTQSGIFTFSESQLVSIPVPDSLAGFFGQFTLPDFSQIFNSEVWIVAGTIAVVASLETLLCVEATDKLDPQKRVTPTNRELIAQGTGNMVSGMIGGLPITQVIVRSSANIQSGGKTKASAFFHGILLLVSVMTIPTLLNMIPMASLAAILFIVGFKLAKPATFKAMYDKGMGQFIPFIITIVGILAFDLLVGIGMGMAVAIVQILWNNYKVPYHFDPNAYKEGEPITIEMSEDVSFLNKASIMRTLNQLPDDAHVIIDKSKTKNIHTDILEIIEDFKQNAPARGIIVETINFKSKKEQIDPVSAFGEVILKNDVSLAKKKQKKENGEQPVSSVVTAES